MRLIRVEQVDETGRSGVTTAIGWDITTGERLSFSGDWCVMRIIKEAVEKADDVYSLPIAEIEDWQVS